MTLVKLELVLTVGEEDIVTGAHIPFLGRNYYAEVFFNPQLERKEVKFNQSKFRIHLNPAMNVQQAIRAALETRYRQRAVEKLTPG